MTLSITYIPNNDTYYFPHKGIYIKRWMFAFAYEEYLIDYLGLTMNTQQFRKIANVLMSVPRNGNDLTFDY